MKLLLTSTYATVAIELLNIVTKKPTDMTVAFIPTAADLYPSKPFIEADRAMLIKQGFNVKNISLASIKHEALEIELLHADIVFVAGGNTFYLLQKIRESGFDEIMKRLWGKDMIYVGLSAGSIVAGPDIEIARHIDDPKQAPGLTNFTGLGFVDFVVLPHYDSPQLVSIYNDIVQEALSKGLKVKTLRETEYYISL